MALIWAEVRVGSLFIPGGAVVSGAIAVATTAGAIGYKVYKDKQEEDELKDQILKDRQMLEELEWQIDNPYQQFYKKEPDQISSSEQMSSLTSEPSTFTANP